MWSAVSGASILRREGGASGILVHMRALVPWLLIACGGTSAAPDGPQDRAVCKATFEAALERTCTVEADCVIARSADCCGAILVGIRAGSETSFAAAELSYETCLACPATGCFHDDVTEDGMSPTGVGQSFVAICDGARCRATVR